jgi:hypothetical protein
MRAIIVLCLAAAVLWCGYWFVGSSALQGQLSDWFDQRRDEGWQADYSEIAVNGFPNRFDTTISDIALTDPGTGVSWEAPFFQLLTLSYKPNLIRAVWPLTQAIATPNTRYDILSKNMQGSIRVGAEPSIPLEDARFVIDGPRIRTNEWLTEAEALELYFRGIESSVNRPGQSDASEDQTPRKTAIGENSYKFFLDTKNLILPVRVRRLLDPAGLQPDSIKKIRLDATIGFDKQWDLSAIEESRPQPHSIKLRVARATWGKLDLRAAGDLNIDKGGRATGEVTIKAKNWREILEIIERSGLLPKSFIPLIERALEVATGFSGPSNSLDIPLSFDAGRISIGILPLGQAPLFRLR